MATEEQIRAVARSAADRLRRRVSTEGDAVVVEGANCMIRALIAADDPDGAYIATKTRVASVLGGVSSRNDAAYHRIVEWNAEPGRTVDEVIAVLERVAAGEGAS